MGSLTILVDFDDTCCRDSYPHRGEEISGAVSVLRDLCKKGHRLILWTCREHVSINGVDPLQESLDWFESYDIPLYAVNEDPFVGSVWMFPSRKVHGDLLIDDKALGIPKTDGVVDWKSVRSSWSPKGLSNRVRLAPYWSVWASVL